MPMNRECVRLETQLRLSFEGGAWHGPSVLESLDGVSAEAAFEHPIVGAHSIWELALHLIAGYRLVLRRLAGDGRQLTTEEEWPPVPVPTTAGWQDTVNTLRELNSDLRRAVLGFDPERLDQPLVAEPPYSAYTQFIGTTQHDLYHAGQIILLKRAMVT
jgi:DinB family protein